MLKGISQEKPPVYVQSKLSDIKLIIESNEKGKKAQALVPILQEKIDTLESVARFLHARIASCNTIREAHERQIINLHEIHMNDSLIIVNERIINKDLGKQLKKTNQKLISTKAGLWFVIVSSFVTTITLILK